MAAANARFRLGRRRQRSTNSPEFVGLAAREFVEFEAVTRFVRVFHSSLHSELVGGVGQHEAKRDLLPGFYLGGNVDGDSTLAQIEDPPVDGSCSIEHLDVAFNSEAGMPSLCTLSDPRSFIDWDHRGMAGSFGRLNVREDNETCISQCSFVLEKIDILITQANLQKPTALGPAALLRRASTRTPQTFNQRGNVFGSAQIIQPKRCYLLLRIAHHLPEGPVCCQQLPCAFAADICREGQSFDHLLDAERGMYYEGMDLATVQLKATGDQPQGLLFRAPDKGMEGTTAAGADSAQV